MKLNPKFHGMLYTADLSDKAANVLRYAINSAKRHDAKIIVLHVLESMPAFAKIDIAEKKEHEILKEKIGFTFGAQNWHYSISPVSI